MTIQEALKTDTTRGPLSPIDRACIRLARAMGYSLQSVAFMNLVTASTVQTLTKGMPMPYKDGVQFQKAREFICEMLAKDLGLTSKEDWSSIDPLMVTACERVADRIELLSQRGGERRFGLVEAVA